MNRKTASTINDQELDALYERLDKHSRALDRAHAFTEQWAGDMTTVTRSEAADLFASLIQLNGWEQTDARPRLLAVPTVTKEAG